MRKFRYLSAIVGLGMLLAGVGVVPARAIDTIDCTSASAKNSAFCKAADKDDAQPLVQQIINILLFIIGAVSVIVIVIGGLQYVTSNGDSNKITTAKNTILYSVIGLVVAILATLIVNTVLNQFT